MVRSLVIGYGNPSRRDDGIALHVVNALRRGWGDPALEGTEDGWEELGHERDALYLQQLTPELAGVVADYDLAIFVDAALPRAAMPVHVDRVEPGYRPAAVWHHMGPGTLLALARQLHGRAPEAFVVSIQGHDFNFGHLLSPQTAAALPEAVELVLKLIAEKEAATGG